MLLGGWLGAREALEWGLVNRVAPAGQVTKMLDEVTNALAALSSSAGRTVKALANRAPEVELGAGLALAKALVADS